MMLKTLIIQLQPQLQLLKLLKQLPQKKLLKYKSKLIKTLDLVEMMISVMIMENA